MTSFLASVFRNNYYIRLKMQFLSTSSIQPQVTTFRQLKKKFVFIDLSENEYNNLIIILYPYNTTGMIKKILHILIINMILYYIIIFNKFFSIGLFLVVIFKLIIL